ncbi:hypothetical protein VP01_10801g1, partial [Puccinia sorghi]
SPGSSFCAATTDRGSVSTDRPSQAPTSTTNLSSYALSLQPTLVPARGTFVDALISSNVVLYLSFQLLNNFILARPDQSLLFLPGSKHELFRMPQLSLLDKRLLMRFFQSILDSDQLVLREPVLSVSFLLLLHSYYILEIADELLSKYLCPLPYSITNPKLVSVIGALALLAQEEPSALPVVRRLKTLLREIGRQPSTMVSALPAALLLG